MVATGLAVVAYSFDSTIATSGFSAASSLDGSRYVYVMDCRYSVSYALSSIG